MSEKLLYKVIVKGRVQGVGFRWSAAREAESRGISGFVKNMSDGSVYIEAEGPREQLDAFTEWCKRGPGIGYVESVDISLWPAPGYSGFVIKH